MRMERTAASNVAKDGDGTYATLTSLVRHSELWDLSNFQGNILLQAFTLAGHGQRVAELST